MKALRLGQIASRLGESVAAALAETTNEMNDGLGDLLGRDVLARQHVPVLLSRATRSFQDLLGQPVLAGRRSTRAADRDDEVVVPRELLRHPSRAVAAFYHNAVREQARHRRVPLHARVANE